MPLRTVDIDSPYPPDEVCRRLSAIIRGEVWYLSPAAREAGDREGVFQGWIRDQAFKIERVIFYRNSFLPTVRGSVSAQDTGTRVQLRMTLHPFVAVFLACWFGGVTSVFIMTIWSGQQGLAIPVLFLLLMLGGGGALTALGFVPEAKKAERLLRRCCGAAEQGDEADER